ncbi:MAG: LuxR C-terminal-related transcriptional regulator [Pigmentiphaga sp.]|nr:LuxR C-terminal-related transcriptional regulator [Pigmentiphaga sp.]
MSPEVLPSKLQAPDTAQAVARPRLLETLDASPGWRVLVLRAPAGYGKTTLMSQLFGQLRQTGQACRWLTLDAGDDDVGQLALHLQAALGADGPGSAGGAALPFGVWLAELEQRALSQVLFLDEVEAVTDTAVVQMLTRLLRFAPPTLRFVIGARPAAPLDFNRLRAGGEVVEWHARQLRFSADETSEFLRRHAGQGIAGAWRDLLAERCEGWPALLSLGVAALGQPGAPQDLPAALQNPDSDLAAYLSGEIIDRLPPDMRDFMLRTSILPELDAALCAAVCEDAAPRRLQDLARGGGLIPLEPIAPGRYRYPALLRACLQARLRSGQPALAARLQRRVALAHESQGQWPQAVEHALESGDAVFAAELLERGAKPLVKAGHLAAILRWLRRLPPHVADTRPDIVWAAARAHAYFQQIEHAETRLRQLFALAEHGPFDVGTWEDCLALEALIQAAVENIPQLEVVVERNLARASGAYARGIMLNLQASAKLAKSEFEASLVLLDRADQDNGRASNLFGLSATRALRAAAWSAQGYPRRGLAAFGAATARLPGGSAADTEGGAADEAGLAFEPSSEEAVGSGVQAELLYEADALDAARRLQALYPPGADGYLSLSLTVGAHITAARLAFVAQGLEPALRLLDDSLAHAAERRFARLVFACQWERVRLATLANDLAQARHWTTLAAPWAANGLLFYTTDTEACQVAGWRLRLRSGEAGGVLPAIREAGLAAKSVGRGWRALKLALLEAEALRSLGRSGEADGLLAAALIEGGSQGFVRTFADEGEPVVSRLRGWLASGRLPAGVERDLPLRILRAAGAAPPPQPGAALGKDGDFNPRERELLAALAKGSRNRELAGAFRISENTVKWYLKNLYLKLDARNRAEAILRARQRGLIR